MLIRGAQLFGQLVESAELREQVATQYPYTMATEHPAMAYAVWYEVGQAVL